MADEKVADQLRPTNVIDFDVGPQELSQSCQSTVAVYMQEFN